MQCAQPGDPALNAGSRKANKDSDAGALDPKRNCSQKNRTTNCATKVHHSPSVGGLQTLGRMHFFAQMKLAS